MRGTELVDPEARHNASRKWSGVSRVKGPTWARLPLLALSSFGISVFWSMVSGNAPPYLASLGLSKSDIAIVMGAGPLSGLLVQPIVGVFSDSSTSKFGRRRPPIVWGALICFFALFLFGFPTTFASMLTRSEGARKAITIFIVSTSIYVLDFSINAIIAGHRGLLVDILPASEQDIGNAWMGRMGAVGGLMAHFIGNMSLPELFPFLGNTQIQIISVIMSIIVLLTNGGTILSVQERVLLEPSGSSGTRASEGVWKSLSNTVKELWTTTVNLPPLIYRICVIHFVATLGWLPLWSYVSLWVSDLYYQENPRSPLDVNGEAGMRAANRALMYASIANTICVAIMPFFASSSPSGKAMDGSWSDGTDRWKDVGGARTRWKMHSCSFWTLSQAILTFALGATWFVDSVATASIIMLIVGISASVHAWAPGAVLGEVIHTTSTNPRSRSSYALVSASEPISVEVRSSMEAHHGDASKRVPGTSGYEHVDHHRAQRHHINDSIEFKDIDDEDDSGTESAVQDKAGTIFGIQNVFIVLSQFVAIGVSSIVFALTEYPVGGSSVDAEVMLKSNATSPVTEAIRGMSREAMRADTGKKPFDSIGFLLRRVILFFCERASILKCLQNRLGAISSAVATYMCWKLSKQIRA
ncbi:uncharacterized protein EI90DRAFT_3286622 [Cantharellus anzutake]|uniref:uncharacterized protein n=1 Tax=Cantharellus anzutake TaxID=1750568 RepID=UPI0019047196|nr:uncharacterized protein EI90DRAFT_3286622 [Cantharellus anzutake]KAF8339114.1 hypothetical protein EI90DRAFT_3286622 [Cantharellus anzutake]